MQYHMRSATMSGSQKVSVDALEKHHFAESLLICTKYNFKVTATSPPETVSLVLKFPIILIPKLPCVKHPLEFLFP